MENRMNISDLPLLRAILLYLLNNSRSGLDKIHISKILYYAQQEHLVRYALPICEESFAAKRLGPVPVYIDKALNYVSEEKKTSADENLKNLINGISVRYENIDGKSVAIYVSSPNAQYDEDELSASTIEVLNDCLLKYGDMPSDQLSELSHQDKAWIRANEQFERTGEPAIIPLYDIAEAGNALPGMLREIKESQLLKSAWA